MTDLIERYLEDFEAGQTFRSGRIRIDVDRIKRFASEFDPQPFHLDERAASDSIFGGLAASGWHTAAITMRLLVESDLAPAGGIVGAGFDELRGRGLFVPATSCMWKAKCWRCGRRNHGRSKVWSSCARRR